MCELRQNVKAATVMVNMELVTTSNIKNKIIINVIIEICRCENCALKFVQI